MLRYGIGMAKEVKGNDRRKNIRIYHALYGSASADTSANELMSKV